MLLVPDIQFHVLVAYGINSVHGFFYKKPLYKQPSIRQPKI